MRDGRKPSSDPRYSCGWHYRKNTFNKERRQFEKMSSFETQAAGLARLGLSGPQHPSTPSRHPGTPRLPGTRPLPSLPAVPGTRAGVHGSAAACFGVTPRSRQLAPPHRFSKKGGVPLQGRGSQAPGSVARRVRVRDASWERARGRVCRAATPVWAPARSRAPRSPLSRFSARAPTELRQGTS